MRRPLAALGITGAIAAAGIYWASFRTPAADPAAESNYVNPALCSGCHTQIAKTYALTGMGRSFSRPRAETNVEDYTRHNEILHRASSRSYTMLSRDDKFFQQRHETGHDGKPANVAEMEVQYVIGSGNHARTYLHRTSEGKLIELPVTWYSENGGYWAMSPGYDRPNPSDFRRAISRECFSCHNAYPAEAGGDDPVFSEALPEGIDCQRCHGPGRAHIAAASSAHPKPESIRKAIVNPARLDRRLQLDVCMQCHLQTTAIRSPDSLRRFDRPPFSYQPGQPLAEFAVYFDYPGEPDRFEIDHAEYRLAQSACFRKSQLTCTTCHNPHEQARAADALPRYQAACRNCHVEAHGNPVKAAFTDCVGCHMPRRRAQDVVHAVMTDHYIQRRKPAGDLLAPIEETHDEKNPYRGEIVIYDLAQSHVADAELYRAVAQARQEGNVDAGIASLESAIQRLHPKEAEFYFELGKAYHVAGKDGQAIHWLEEAVQRRPAFRSAQKELAAALSASGQLTRATQILEGLGPDSGVRSDLANLYLQQGRLDEAEQSARQAISLYPDLPASHNLLGLTRLRKNDQAAAETAFRDAIRLQPDFAEARTNLGNLLAASGDLPQAIYHLRIAVKNAPENVEAHFDLGEALAASRSYDQAVQQLEEVVRLNPNHARAHIDLGRLLSMKGLSGKAAGHYRRAVEIDANQPDAYFYLGGILAQNREMSEAERQFGKALELDPNYYEAHFALGQLLAARGDVQEARSHFAAAAQSPDPELSKAASRLRK